MAMLSSAWYGVAFILRMTFSTNSNSCVLQTCFPVPDDPLDPTHLKELPDAASDDVLFGKVCQLDPNGW